MMKPVHSSIIDFSFSYVKPQFVIEKDILVKFEPYYADPYDDDFEVIELTILLFKGGKQLDYCGDKPYNIVIGNGIYQFEVKRVARNTFSISVKRDMAQ